MWMKLGTMPVSAVGPRVREMVTSAPDRWA